MAQDKKLGEILVDNGQLTSDQLDRVLDQQGEQPEVMLGQLCINLAYLTRDLVQSVLVSNQKRQSLGEMLRHANLVTDEQLAEAVEEQEGRGGRLGEILVRHGAVSEADLTAQLARQYNFPVVSLADTNPPRVVKNLINPVYAAQRQIVPISLVGNRLTVALADPSAGQVVHDLEHVTGLEVSAVLAVPSEIRRYYRKLYRRDPSDALGERGANRTLAAKNEMNEPNFLDPAPPLPEEGEAPTFKRGGRFRNPAQGDASGYVETEVDLWADLAEDEEITEEFDGIDMDDNIEVLETDTEAPQSAYTESVEDSPVVQIIVQTIISRALALNASDIHIERNVKGALLRMRIDGVLHRLRLEKLEPAFQKNYRSIIARLKILCQMDITEKRRPQDGSFRMMIRRDGKLSNVDFRLASMPGRFGEGMVVRLLDQRKAPRSLEGLGLSPSICSRFMGVLQRPTGIVLVTGPTGSGKSSTLYAALRSLYSPKIKIVTAEDPIEYTHPGIVQSEVNADLGNTFARYLRSFLRQDPDIIMVGEIRDSETAEMALRAAQTGHLLLSTLHSINSTATIQRLRDLEMDANSISSTLNAVMAQRLIRRNCTDCEEAYRPGEEILDEWFSTAPEDLEFKRGRGCPRCNQTGFSGRMALNELWLPSSAEQILINKDVSSEELRRHALEHTMSLAEDALLKVYAGLTTLEEALRVVPYEDIVHLRGLGPARAREEWLRSTFSSSLTGDEGGLPDLEKKSA